MSGSKVLQEEGKAHQEDTKAADVSLHEDAKNIGEKLHKQAKKAKKAKKPKAPAKPEAPTYPSKTTINAYGFLRVHAKVLQAIGVKSATRADGKAIHQITPAVITGYDAASKTLTIKLGGS